MNDTMINPYGVTAAPSVLAEQSRHEQGNALAAVEEARAVTEIKALVVMAKQFPRDPGASMDRILQECRRPTLAEKAVYVFPRGKETVTGPSIRLAEMMARNWGNIKFGVDVLERANGRSVLRAYAWDLETNTYIDRKFEVRHWRTTKSGGYAITDDRDIYEMEANAGSRRMRACLLQVLPGDVTSIAVESCRAVCSDRLIAAMNDPNARDGQVKGIIKAFTSFGVTQKDLEQFLGGVEAKVWTADHAVRLRELKTSLEDGMVSLGDAFAHLANENQNEAISAEQTKELMALGNKTGKQGDISVWLKKRGIAKVADIPAAQYDEAKAYIQSLIAAEAPPTEESAGAPGA